MAVDGSSGRSSSIPTSRRAQVAARRRHREAYEQSLDEYRSLPAVTQDGVCIRLEANIESPDDAGRAAERGAEGIGLFRSEFLLAGGGQGALAEETQFAAYRRLIEGAGGRRVTVRTFDVSEPQLAIEHAGVEGARAARPARDPAQPGARRDLPGHSCARCRAASTVRSEIMFPFVSGVNELRAARAAVRRAEDTLLARGIATPEVPIGVMIEVRPRADSRSPWRRSGFLQHRTNDLIQHPWPSIATTIACRAYTSRSIRRSCG